MFISADSNIYLNLPSFLCQRADDVLASREVFENRTDINKKRIKVKGVKQGER